MMMSAQEEPQYVSNTDPAQGFSTVTSLPSQIPEQTMQPQPNDTQKPPVHFVKARLKDGTTKTLCLSHDDYLKVKAQKLKAQLIRAQQAKLQQLLQCQPTATVTTAAGGIMNAAGDFEQAPVLQNPDASAPVKKNLDTFDDLINVLQKQTGAEGGNLELIPVNPNEVYVKEEPQDPSYEHQPNGQAALLVKGGVKQEVDAAAQLLSTSRATSNPQSTSQFIRAGLETLTNPEEPGPSSTQIANIVQFLEQDENTFRVTATDPRTSQVVEQTTVNSSLHGLTSAQLSMARSAANAQVSAGPHVTYITSAAPMGSLGAVGIPNGQINNMQLMQQRQQQQLQKQSQQQHAGAANPLKTISISAMPAMQNVKLRPNAAQQIQLAPVPDIPHGQAQAAAPAQPQLMQVTASAADMAQQQKLHNISSWNGTNSVAASSAAGNVSQPSIHVSTTQKGMPQVTFQQPQAQLQQHQQSIVPVPQPIMSAAASTSANVPVIGNLTFANGMLQISSVSTNNMPVVSAGNLMSASTAAIHEYLNNNGIEAMES
jgi:hypothetical protein